MTFQFETTCINSTAEAIWDMTDNDKEVTWKTFVKHVPLASIKDIFPMYSYRGEMYNPDTGELKIGFHIKDDWAVRFAKSRYKGKPCYFIQHSAIEYVWTA